MKTTLFQPSVTMEDSGAIEIDWTSSVVNTHDGDEEVAIEDEHGYKMDDILDLTASTAQKLRNLADYIEDFEARSLLACPTCGQVKS